MSPLRTTLALVAASIVAISSTARAIPGLGSSRPAVTLVDGWDRPLDLGKAGGKPVLLVYEDKESSSQNAAFKADLAALARGDRYKTAITLVAVADLEGYDYWPVRGFVKDAIQGESHKFGTVIYCDWNGSARKAMGLRRGVSNIVLYGPDGKVRFSHEGPMSAERRREAIDLLRKQVGGQ